MSIAFIIRLQILFYSHIYEYSTYMLLNNGHILDMYFIYYPHTVCARASPRYAWHTQRPQENVGSRDPTHLIFSLDTVL